MKGRVVWSFWCGLVYLMVCSACTPKPTPSENQEVEVEAAPAVEEQEKAAVGEPGQMAKGEEALFGAEDSEPPGSIPKRMEVDGIDLDKLSMSDEMLDGSPHKSIFGDDAVLQGDGEGELKIAPGAGTSEAAKGEEGFGRIGGDGTTSKASKSIKASYALKALDMGATCDESNVRRVVDVEGDVRSGRDEVGRLKPRVCSYIGPRAWRFGPRRHDERRGVRRWPT